VLAANLMAMLVQSMSAKLGIATRRNLPEVCRERFSRRTNIFLWLQAEVVAMATDIAEFVGAAIGLNLLFGIALFPAALLTGVAAMIILALQARGFRRLEAVIAGLIGVIVGAFAFQVFLADPSPSAIAGGLDPRVQRDRGVLLAVGIIGATAVMPHVIYLHSALTQHRVVGATEEEKRRIFHFELVDVVIAMTIAGVINMSMLIIAASRLDQGLVDVGDDHGGLSALGTYLGSNADLLRVALPASPPPASGRWPPGVMQVHRPAVPTFSGAVTMPLRPS
jgi:manganese transport protein